MGEKIINSDPYKKMSVTARMLYIGFCAAADVDDYIEAPERIMAQYGDNGEYVKELMRNRYLVPSCGGFVVVTSAHMRDYLCGVSAKKTEKPSAIPTVDEVRSYCEERMNGIDAERFFDYYQRQGWKLANGRVMRDWRAAVRTWEGKNKKDAPGSFVTDEFFGAALKRSYGG